MTYTIPTYKYSFFIFYNNICTHLTRTVFRIPKKNTNSVNFWTSNPPLLYRSCFLRVCSTLGADIILGCNSDYIYTIGYSLRRKEDNLMTMGKFLCFSTNFKSILFYALFVTSTTISINYDSFSTPT